MFNYKKFKELRKKKKISIEDLSAKIGVADSTLYKYQSGLYTPPEDVLEKICSELDVNLSELVNEFAGETETPNTSAVWKDEAYKRVVEENDRLWKMIEFFTSGKPLSEANQQRLKMLGNRFATTPQMVRLPVTPILRIA